MTVLALLILLDLVGLAVTVRLAQSQLGVVGWGLPPDGP